MYTTIVALLIATKMGQKMFLLWGNHVEWYDDLGKTACYFKFPSCLKSSTSCKENISQSEIFCILGVKCFGKRDKKSNKIFFNVVKI